MAVGARPHSAELIDEHQKAGDVHRFVAAHIAQPAKAEQQPADHQQINRDDPLDRRHIAFESAAHYRQDNVGHTPIQRRHKRADADGEQHPPFALYTGSAL